MTSRVSFPALFEHAPQVAVVVDCALSILVTNAAGRRFFGREMHALEGQSLFDVLPSAADTRPAWHERLRLSYQQILDTGSGVTLLLPARDGMHPEPAGPGGGEAALPGGIWHVCHSPVFDPQGRMTAIATYALALEGVEMAINQVAGLAATRAASLPAGSSAVVPSVATGPAGAAMAMQGEAAALIADAPRSVTADAADPADAADAADAGPAIKALRILLVEDNDDLRTMTVKLLQSLGHHVTGAGDAEQALRHLETGSFDLLFTDLSLPKMTGAELARLVLQQHRPMQVVITSGYGRALANAQNLDALFLPKPYRLADLQEVFAQIGQELERRSTSA